MLSRHCRCAVRGQSRPRAAPRLRIVHACHTPPTAHRLYFLVCVNRMRATILTKQSRIRNKRCGNCQSIILKEIVQVHIIHVNNSLVEYTTCFNLCFRPTKKIVLVFTVYRRSSFWMSSMITCFPPTNLNLKC